MLERLIEFSLQQRLAVILFALGFGAFGVYSFSQLPIEAFPDVTDTQVTVITLFAGHAPEEVERQVTLPIEKELNGLPHLTRMRSVSMFGLSQVTLTFDEGMGDYFARQLVSEKLPDADLPSGITPTLGPLATPVGEIYRYTLVSPTKTPMDLRTIQDFTMERAFRQVDGVADVVSFGGFEKEFHVQVDPARLKSLNVTLSQVYQALQNSNANAGGNYIQHGAEEYVVRGLGSLGSIEDIRRVVVAARQGIPVTIGDVARVEVGNVLRRGAVSMANDYGQQPDVVEGIVLLRKGSAPAPVLEAVHKKVEELNNDVLPKDVKIVPYYDRSALVETTLTTVIHSLIEGGVLVIAVLLVFLLSLRGALVVATVIPLSLLTSFVYLKLRGMSANLLSMGAVDFGILVDGAVVIVENVFARLGHRKPDESPQDTIRRATIEVAKPTLFSLAIIIVAYVPIFTLQRVEGRIFSPMANTVASALVGALLFSLTLVPVLCSLTLANAKEKESPVVRLAEHLYLPSLGWVLRHRAVTLLAAVLALAASVWLGVRKVGSEFLPDLNEGILWVTATLPPEISLEESQRSLPRIEAALKAFPEVKTVVAQVGRPEDGTDAKAVNNIEMLVDLRPLKTWTTATTVDGLIEKMSAAVKATTLGIDFNFSMPIKDNVEESISGIKGAIAIKLFGEDLDVLGDKAEEIRKVLLTVPGVADLAVLQAGELPQVQVDIDRDRISRFGLNVADVQQAIETAIGGKVATELWEGQKHFGVTVRFAEAFRNNVDKLRDVPVFTPDGNPIPLSELATVHVGKGRAAINREANLRYVGIKCNVRGRDMGSLVADAQARVKAKVKLPDGYQLTWGGEFENQQRAMTRLALVIPLSVLLIFLILFRAFGSLRSAALILANIPFALIGGIVGLWATGMNLSVAAAVGFIALMGQAVLNGVLMVSQFNALREEGLSVLEAVKKGAQGRLRAVLMTAALAALGLLPAATAHGIGAETQRPLAIVVIGGLVSATLLTLYVLPVIYQLATPDKKPLLRAVPVEHAPELGA
jgi:cobalt-zinc-cadmium resistance protein CzcA